MEVKDFGNDLIRSDIKRLKKLKSLEQDLEKYFNAHAGQLRHFGQLSCEIAFHEGYRVCKQRIAVAHPRLSPSEGCRLWFVITKSGTYIRCLLYSAKEEGKYTKSKCFRVIRERLENLSAT